LSEKTDTSQPPAARQTDDANGVTVRHFCYDIGVYLRRAGPAARRLALAEKLQLWRLVDG